MIGNAVTQLVQSGALPAAVPLFHAGRGRWPFSGEEEGAGALRASENVDVRLTRWLPIEHDLPAHHRHHHQRVLELRSRNRQKIAIDDNEIGELPYQKRALSALPHGGNPNQIQRRSNCPTPPNVRAELRAKEIQRRRRRRHQ